MAAAGFDAAAYFERQFRKLEQVAASGTPALKATVSQSLLDLLSTYRLKLQLGVYQTRLVRAGSILASLGDHQLALSQCFGPILGTAKLEAKGVGAVRLRVLADFGSVGCSFALLQQRDPSIDLAASTVTVRTLLKRVREGMAACAKHESLYWLVLNGTRLAYSLCTPLMRPERAAEAVETLGWCALCMEGMLPLLASRFLPWRVQLYVALCHCYEAIGMPQAAAKAVAHALSRHEQLKALDKHDPVPPTAAMQADYEKAERSLTALQFKYTTCLGPDAVHDASLVEALPTTFGEDAAPQLAALVEALCDYTAAGRVLTPAPPAEARAALVRELVSAAMALAAPLVALMTTREEAKATAEAAVEAAATARETAASAAATAAEGAAAEGTAEEGAAETKDGAFLTAYGPNSIFGELALESDQPRGATVRAIAAAAASSESGGDEDDYSDRPDAVLLKIPHTMCRLLRGNVGLRARLAKIRRGFERPRSQYQGVQGSHMTLSEQTPGAFGASDAGTALRSIGVPEVDAEERAAQLE